MSRDAVAIVACLPVALLLAVVMLAVFRGRITSPGRRARGVHTRAECEPWTGCPVADAGTEPAAGGAGNTRP